MCRAKRRGPRTASTTTDANLDCAFVENALFLHRSLILKSHQNRIEVVTRPAITPQLLFLLSSWQLRPHSHRQHSITTPYFNSLNIWGNATPTHSLMKHWIFHSICLSLGRKRVVVNQNICLFYLRCCVEVSNSRTSNWQKFCLWNENVLSFFFAVSYSLDEGVSPIVLQLLQSAICPPTASTTSR